MNLKAWPLDEELETEPSTATIVVVLAPPHRSQSVGSFPTQRFPPRSIARGVGNNRDRSLKPPTAGANRPLKRAMNGSQKRNAGGWSSGRRSGRVDERDEHTRSMQTTASFTPSVDCPQQTRPHQPRVSRVRGPTANVTMQVVAPSFRRGSCCYHGAGGDL